MKSIPIEAITMTGFVRPSIGRLVQHVVAPTGRSRPCPDSGARTLVTTNWQNLLPKAERLKAAGLLDLLVVADDAAWGAPAPD